MNNEKTKEHEIVIQYGLEMRDDRIPSMVREGTYEVEKNIFTTPTDIVYFCRQALRLDRQCEEHLYEMVFNVKGQIVGLFEVSHGTISQTVVGLKELFIRALLCGGSSIVIIHNHPSGDTTPSLQDEGMAGRIAESANLLDIKLLDFIIVGDDYYSFAEHKEIDD